MAAQPEAGAGLVADGQPVDRLAVRPGDQPLPVPNSEPDIQSRVIADLIARRAVGIERYETALQPFNRRDGLRDAYEEALDLSCYLRQLIAERDQVRSKAWDLVAPAVADTPSANTLVIAESVMKAITPLVNAVASSKAGMVSVPGEDLRTVLNAIAYNERSAASWLSSPTRAAADRLSDIARQAPGATA